MSTDKTKERLFALFQEKKISQTELQTLLDAIDTKDSFFYKVYLFLINPFQKIAGFKSLVLGLFIILLMAFFAVKADGHFPDITSFISTRELNRKLNFIETLSELLIQCSILALFFYLYAFIFQKGKARFIDFLGTVCFSHFPYLLGVLYILIFRNLYPSLLVSTDVHPGRYVMYIFLHLCITWQYVTYFFSFKESSGLKDTRLWTGFIACMILAIFTSGILIQNIYGLHKVKL